MRKTCASHERGDNVGHICDTISCTNLAHQMLLQGPVMVTCQQDGLHQLNAFQLARRKVTLPCDAHQCLAERRFAGVNLFDLDRSLWLPARCEVLLRELEVLVSELTLRQQDMDQTRIPVRSFQCPTTDCLHRSSTTSHDPPEFVGDSAKRSLWCCSSTKCNAHRYFSNFELR